MLAIVLFFCFFFVFLAVFDHLYTTLKLDRNKVSVILTVIMMGNVN